MSIQSLTRRLSLCVLLLTLGTSCSAADLIGGPPSSQSWLVIDEDDQLGRITMTYVDVLKGGATSQAGGVYRMDVTGTCSFTVPLSGNWNGQIIRLTSTGGACGVGYILTMDGNTNGEYGDADAMSGTYRISYNGAWSGVETGTWRATLVH
jgi:hypothetical protein